MPDIEQLKTKADEEFNLLKQRADQMGIEYGPNIGKETLRARINDVLNSSNTTKEDTPSWIKRKNIKDKALRLIRVRITNMNTDKKNIPGEIITVYNRNVGRVSKYIPFGPEESLDGYHIPYIIYAYLKNKKFASRTKRKGQLHPTTKLVNEYQLEVLPQLTEAELKKLSNDQKIKQSIDTTAGSLI